MIRLHRLRGEPLFLNADLIESVESCPDTTITLLDGRCLVVADAPEAIVDRIVRFRASLLVAADELRSSRPTLRVVPETPVPGPVGTAPEGRP